MCDAKLDCSYHLNLADGQVWNLVATAETKKIIDTGASLMGLTPGNASGGRQNFYISSDLATLRKSDTIPLNGNSKFSGLPLNGWHPVKTGHVTIWSNPESPDIVCEVSDEVVPMLDMTRFILSLYPIYRQAIFSGGLLFHTALLEYQGKGVLITARSGTGKSTCCQRVPSPWHALCDDQALIMKVDDGYHVHPLPTWSDYFEGRPLRSWDVSKHIPLAGIFFLEQSQRDEAEPLGSGKAAQFIFETAKYIFYRYTVNLDPIEKSRISKAMFDNACALSDNVPSFTLRSTLDGKFWEEMEKVLL